MEFATVLLSCAITKAQPPRFRFSFTDATKVSCQWHSALLFKFDNYSQRVDHLLLPVAPQMIIYDNGCSLHRYALNREPHFFLDTKFRIDRVHWKNHTACQTSYNLDSYVYSPFVKGINSQANEQGNAGTRRIATQVAYMKSSTAMQYVKYFFCRWNREKKNMAKAN